MTIRRTLTHLVLSMAAWTLLVGTVTSGPAIAQSAPSEQQEIKNPPYIVEWVYRVKWGYQDEF